MPNTTEGTPARLRMLSWMKRVRRLGRAYSSRYTAAPMPTGKASAMQATAIPNEPTRPCQTPACAGSDARFEVRKSVPRSWTTGRAWEMTRARSVMRTSSGKMRQSSSTP